jgi:hypothetical protein
MLSMQNGGLSMLLQVCIQTYREHDTVGLIATVTGISDINNQNSDTKATTGMALCSHLLVIDFLLLHLVSIPLLF